MTVLAAFQILLSRYSGQSDICVGTPIANRSATQTEALIGFFVNTLVLRSHIDPQRSFLLTLADVRETVLEAFAHQDVPFEKLVEYLDPERSLTHTPLFQVMFVYSEGAGEELHLPGLTLAPVDGGEIRAKFDLTLRVTMRPDGPLVAMVYSQYLYNGDTIEAFLKHLRIFLIQALDDADRPLQGLDLLDEREKARVLLGSDREREPFVPIHLSVARHAFTMPEAIAIYSDSGRSFRALNQRADTVAAALQQHGVRRGDRVVLLAESGFHWVAAMLGCLKCGAAYVPVDPAFPRARVEQILEDAQPVLVLGNLSADLSYAHLPIDGAFIETTAEIRPLVDGDDLAYMIYTSGSTGKPKGVCVSHVNLWHYLIEIERRLMLPEKASMAALSTVAADLGNTMLFGALFTGNTLRIIDKETSLDAVLLAEAFLRLPVTVLKLVPSHLKALLAGAGGEVLPTDLLILGGEALDRTLLAAIADHRPSLRIINHYGPTETTIGCMTQAVSSLGLSDGNTAVPIGLPLDNSRALIADPYLRLQPVGVPGELCIGGPAVARGYHSRPAATAAAFVPDPTGAIPGARLYRTGDLVRLPASPDNQIPKVVFLGRIDHQVKINGYRIEPGEIQAALTSHDLVEDGAVLPRQIGQSTVLLAYVVARDGLLAEDIKQFLQKRLPAYMIPTAFVFLTNLPLNANGKLDRARLPAFAPLTEPSKQGEALRSNSEQVIAEIWTEILGARNVYADSDFFALGGHSLAATRIVAHVGRHFSVKLPVRLVFTQPRLRGFAALVEEERQRCRQEALPLKAVPRDDLAPLSFAQQRLWVLNQLEGPSHTYNVPIILRLTGRLNTSALESAMQAIVARHEVLRTCFVAREGTPYQRIFDQVPIHLNHIDLAALPAKEMLLDRLQSRYIAPESRTCFDLGKCPLIRLHLLSLGPEDRILMVTLHHIVSDGWSTGIMVRELVRFYHTTVTGVPHGLEPLPLQYADFSYWQRRWLEGDMYEQQLSYWKMQLNGAPPQIDMPTDFPRPQITRYAGQVLHDLMAPEIEPKVKAFSLQHGLSPFMTLLAAYYVILARYSGQSDLVVGTDVANRNRGEIEPLVGFFINQLALRGKPDAGLSFRAFCNTVRQTALDAYANQDLPFDRLVVELVHERNRAVAPIFQVKFIMQNTPREDVAPMGLDMRPMAWENTVSKFDLTLQVVTGSDGLSCQLEYRTDLYLPETMVSLLRHYQTLLDEALSDPSCPMRTLHMLSHEERRHLLHHHNPISRPVSPLTAPQRFQRTAAQYPEEVALSWEEGVMTFAELERRSNRLAHYLIGLGVTPDTVVAVFLPRSPELIISVLATLKAGAAYLSLDPDYPAKRLGFMLGDAHAVVLLTSDAYLDQLPSFQLNFLTLFCFEAWDMVEVEDTAPPEVILDDLHTAYLIYTSGTTGRPKGVLVTHGGLKNYLDWCSATYRPVTGAPLFSSLGFDATVTALYLPLLEGKTVHLMPLGGELDGLQQILSQKRHLNLIKITPSHMDALAAMGLPENLRDRRAIFVIGGEVLRAETLAVWRRHMPYARFFNEYGPTETVVGCCVYEASEEDLSVPIGTPIFNTRLYILDKRLEPVPRGVPGQLLIAGEGVARGYLNQPALTAARFLPDPYSSQPGTRMYASGDLVILNSKRILTFVARLDDQVKIRGFRIEPAEISAVLLEQRSIVAAEVLIREVIPHDHRLVAYLVSSTHTVDEVQLREALARELPNHMIPAHLVFLKALPYTAHGKLDIAALPLPELGTRHDKSSDLLTATEELLAVVWCDVLGVSNCRPDDDFFDAGGHSLSATTLASRIRKYFDLNLAVSDVFEHATLRRLASHMDRLSRGECLPSLFPYQGLFPPLSFSQQRLWFLDRLEEAPSAYHVPLAFQIVGELNISLLQQALAGVVSRHQVLRTTFAEHEGKVYQRVHEDLQPLLAYQELSETEASVIDLGAWLATVCAAPFDLEEGPLLRMSILGLSGTSHVVVLVLHHIVTDGWSGRILLDELSALYEGLLRNQKVNLPELPIQYLDFAAWQREHLDSVVLASQRTYWNQSLEGAQPFLNLPTDFPRPRVQSFRGAALHFVLPLDLQVRLNEYNRQQGVTLFMSTFAAFSLLLIRYSSSRDISVGTPIANRCHSDLESLIGFFANTLVLRVQLQQDENFVRFLARVRRICLDAYAHQDFPFEQLVETLHPQRSLSHSPLFQVLFTVHPPNTGDRKFCGLQLNHLDTQTHSSKFDLTLHLGETAEGLEGRMEYCTDLFEEATVRRFIAHFQHLLESLLDAPDVPVSYIDYMNERERANLLALAMGPCNVPPRSPLQERVARMAAECGDQPALFFNGKTLSYRRFNQLANGLADQLQKRGVGPEGIVALCFFRSFEMAISLLAVLKAGGAYVPLDPKYPVDRLSYMLNQSGSMLLLTNIQQQSQLPPICPETLLIQLENIPENPETPICRARGDNLFYIIYTSGSTGRPKGIALPRQALDNLMAWHVDHCLGGVSVLQFSSLSFDAHITEMFAAWLTGGCLFLIHEDLQLDADTLMRFLYENGVEKVNIPVSLLNVWAAEYADAVDRFQYLREITCTGEQLLLTQAVRELFERLPHVVLNNHYGPAETHVVTSFTLKGVSRHWPHNVPIGTPLDDTTLFLLDRHGLPVADGILGEVFLGGANLARGYWGRPGLTAEKFVPHPFSARGGERLYRTGDLARRKSTPLEGLEGVVEYVGRTDFMVKIRGLRVEPQEIEALIDASPDVVKSLVLPFLAVDNDLRLVAYVVPREQGLRDEHALRDRIRANAPDYMIPASFVFLDAFPLTPNKKIDRNALPQPLSLVAGRVRPPTTAIQRLVAGLWCELLNRESVDLIDNFFHLGGHSLLVTRLISRLRQKIGVQLSVRSLFEAPQLEAFCQQVEQARHEEAFLLVPLDRTHPVALSYAQQRLWFLDRLEGPSETYNMPAAYRISGSIAGDALCRAIEEVVARHEVLRTRFELIGDEPRQVVIPAECFTVSRCSLEDEAQVEAYLVNNAQTPFDLQSDLPFRATLIQLSDEVHVLLVCAHHIVCDGWSLGRMIQEITLCYKAFAAGQPSPLEPLEIQYGDYSVWQQHWLTSSALQEQLSWWCEHLVGLPALLDLPGDRPRPKTQSHRGASHVFALSNDLLFGLEALGQDHRASLFMVLNALFQTLLYRYSGQEVFAVGSPFANRNHPKLELLVGLFLNTLVFRAQPRAHKPFHEFLEETRETALDAFSHADVPFERVVEAVQPERGLGFSPLFQVMLILQNAPKASADLVEARFEPLAEHLEVSRFDLTLGVSVEPSGLSCTLTYNRDIFDMDTVENMASAFIQLAQAAVVSPQTPLGGLTLLSEAERRRQVEHFNQTQRAFSPSGLCHRVARFSDGPALVFDHAVLDYRPLSVRSAGVQLALAPAPEARVGIYLERTPEMVIAMLGTLSAGAAYVPLDPDYPMDRLAYIVGDAGVERVLTSKALWAAAPLPGCSPLFMEGLGFGPVDHQPAMVHSGQLAYVIYTSGSTGKPKGVAVTRGALDNFLQAMQALVGLTRHDRVLALTTVAFDIAVLELFLPLVEGASVVLCSRDTGRDPSALARLLERESVTVMQATPSTWRLLVDAGWAPPRTLKALCGGEALSQELSHRIRKNNPPVWNLYGPTEATVWTSNCYLSSPREFASGTLSGQELIGRPIANTRLHVLDGNLEPTPVGVPGELFIAGDGLARGYWGQPALTAQSFIPDPHGKENGQRIYRSGDLARYRPDGNLEHLARVDHQVKVRGYRVELGEIETRLNALNNVRQAAVARHGEGGEALLVAYLVCDEPKPERDLLHRLLSANLPEYMVPTVYMFLSELPQTQNRKLDRKSLPAPDAAASRSEFVAPVTATEELLAEIWSELLNVQPVGRGDHFFALGGHSLLATRVATALRKRAELDVPVRILFEAPRLHQLATWIDAHRQDSHSLPPITAADRSKPLALSFSQQRLWFLTQLEGADASYNLPIALQLNGWIDYQALSLAYLKLLHRHQILRTTFSYHGKDPVQQIHDHLVFEPVLIDLSGLAPLHRRAEEEGLCRQLIARDAMWVFELERGPLVRWHYLKTGPINGYLLINMNHIIVDGWSIGLLIKELRHLYQCFCQGLPSALPSPGLQFADFAVWQKTQLKAIVFPQQLAYWKARLEGVPTMIDLPITRSRPPVQRTCGAVVRGRLDSASEGSVKGWSRDRNATLFMTALAAWNVLLARYTGQHDLVVGTDVANRNHPDLEGMIGFFINQLAIRIHVPKQITFGELIAHVRRHTLDAFANQDLPFDYLVGELHIERNRGVAPVFQVKLILQNMPQEHFHLPGLEITGIPRQAVTAKFDLTLILSETDQGLHFVLEYNTDLFDPAPMARMLAHYTQLLSNLCQTPSHDVFRVPMVSLGERALLLESFSGADTEPSRDLISVFQAHAQARGQVSAVVQLGDNKVLMDYAELNRRANQLAAYLLEQGVQVESAVGVCMASGVLQTTCMLAVWKLGACYVPIDTATPPSLLEYILQDAQVTTLLTIEPVLDLLPHHISQFFSTLCIDSDWDTISSSVERQLQFTPPVGLSAYVIYTSGTTGLPKGVKLTRDGLSNLAQAQAEAFSVVPGSRLLQFASLNFDASISEFSMALTAGATLILAPRDKLLPGKELIETLNQQTITHITLPPSAVAVLDPDMVPGLIHLVLAGEASPPELIVRWSIGRTVYNAYGPSEGTVCASISRSNEHSTDPTIGKPMTGMRCFVLDNHLNPQPIGVAGQLCVGGIGLARCYINKPALTAVSFIPNPYSKHASQRLYLTGDRASFTEDGAIVFHGRQDNQVKIRGYRIEPGGIEAALVAQTAVSDAVVLPRGMGAERVLVAFVIPHKGLEHWDEESTRKALGEYLPDYQIPSIFIPLERFPLTPNGKVDRKALGGFETHRVAREIVAPRSPVECSLAAIWEEVLAIERVGITDNFFELGGHSLLATRVFMSVQEELNVDLPVADIFECPTIAELAERVSRRLLEEPTPPPLVARAGSPTLPLSYAQQRLWLTYLLEGPSLTYIIPVANHFQGFMDVRAMVRAITTLVNRHESLRTYFGGTDEAPFLKIGMPIECIPLLDLSPLPDSQRMVSLQRLISAAHGKLYKLTEPPLFRLVIVRLSLQEHALIGSLHHIIADGWSLSVFVRELSKCYTSNLDRIDAELPHLPVQYADFALWQRSWLRDDELNAQLSYWKDKLAGMPLLLELQTDKPRPPKQSFRGAFVTVHIPAESLSNLVALSQAQGTTLFMTLLAAFKVLLYRHSHMPDVAVGSPVAGRPRKALEHLIGFFVNTLVLRDTLSGSMRFTHLLRNVRQTVLEGFRFQQVPFEQIVDICGVPRDPSFSPLVQVMFSLSLEQTPEFFPGLHLAPLQEGVGDAKFDLTLNLTETKSGLYGRLIYCRDLFDVSPMTSFVAHFSALLDAICDRPEEHLDRLSLFDDAAMHRLMEVWNTSEEVWLSGNKVAQMLDSAPDEDPALVMTDAEARCLEIINFRQYKEQAQHMAQHLAALGVGPDVLVGIHMERSPLFVVAQLAVWYAGGAFVPMDPQYPESRLQNTVEDASLSIILTTDTFVGQLQHLPVRLLTPTYFERPTPTASLCQALPDHLAYVIYTSGTTGRPKGVAITHRTLTNLVYWSRQAFGIDASFRTAWVAGVAFDASLWEIWPTLSVHGSLFPASPEVVQGELVDWLESNRINLTFIPTAMADRVFSHSWSRNCTMKVLLVGGQQLTHWPPSHLPFKVHNNYGPTETTVVATSAITPTTPPFEGAIPSIGRPITNHTVYILNRAMTACPAGVSGELHVGGGQARGYYGHPALTAERFVPDPLSQRAGSRLYKTGDFARFQTNGEVAFLGRIDHQIKLRGFRIEIGEIEAALQTHPAVRECAVLLEQQGQHLVAFVVVGRAAVSSDFGEYLSKILPHFMVPAVFHRLSQLPRTANDKIDRSALAELAAERHSETERGTPGLAGNPVEEVLISIWGSVLRRPSLGIHDNFFSLGGHSLSAISLISRIKDSLGCNLAVRDLFDRPTVAEISPLINSQRREPRILTPMTQADRSAPLPPSFAQRRLLFLDALEGSSATYNIPFTYRARGPLDPYMFECCLSEITRRHEVLRTTFVGGHDAAVQKINVDIAPMVFVDLSALSDQRRTSAIRALAAVEANRPFNLAKGPLYRWYFLHLTVDDAVLLLTIHHAVFDGWSMKVMMRELRTLYAAALRGERAELEPLVFQYADFTAWQEHQFTRTEQDRLLAFWRERLAGSTPLLNLPTDRPRPKRLSHEGATLCFALDVALTSRLVSFSGEHSVSLYITLLTAFLTLLARYTGQDDVCVGTPVANRGRSELEPMIGFFVNTLVMRARFDNQPCFRRLLKQVRHSALDAYDNSEIPFEKVVEALCPVRSLSHTPLFQAMFALHDLDRGDEDASLGSIHLTPMVQEVGGARFEISLALTRANGIQGSLEYNTSLFDPETMSRFADHYCGLLSEILVRPNIPFPSLHFISEEERSDLWAKAINRPPPPRQTLPARLRQVAELRGNNTALVTDTIRLSHDQLHRKSVQLAAHLSRRGVGPGDVVAVLLPRSPQLVVSYLAVWHLGATLLPLSLNHPVERRSFVIQDAGARFLILQDPELGDAPHVLNYDFLASCEQLRDEKPVDDLQLGAYIIYTSGSTGRPKGVCVTHFALASVILGSAELFGIQNDDSMPMLASPAFDIMFFELFLPLCVGGACLPIDEEELFQMERLQKRIKPATLLHMVPALAQALAAFLRGNEESLDLRLMFVGGDSVPADLLANLAELLPEITLVELYGPTEATIIATFATSTGMDFHRDYVIGDALPWAEVVILTDALEPLPPGPAGEIFIGGDGLSLGYGGRAGQTACSFLPHPHPGHPGQRLYRTGDLGRLLSNGKLQFLGRKDQQISLRGFRIEPGEIESLLLKLPRVQAATVVVRREGAGMLLIAFVQVEQKAMFDEAAAKTQLKKQIPDYMIPARIVVLDRLPQTPNQKVDRSALAAMPLPEPQAPVVMQPQNLIQAQLVSLWERLLPVHPVSVDADFFALGGHSLLAVRMMAFIKEELGAILPLSTLFEAPTILGLASAIRNQSEPRPWRPLQTLGRNGGGVPVYCVHPVGGGILCYRYLSAVLVNNPVYGLQARGMESGEPLDNHESLQTMAQYYVRELQSHWSQGPFCLLGWSLGGVIAYEMAQILTAAGRQVAFLGLMDAAVPELLQKTDDYAELLCSVFADSNMELTLEELKAVPAADQLTYALEKGKRAGVIPLDYDLGQAKRLLTVLKNNESLAVSYQPQTYHEVVHMFIPTGNEIATPMPLGPTKGWDRLVPNLVVHEVPGTHETMGYPPHVHHLGKIINNILEKTLSIP